MEIKWENVQEVHGSFNLVPGFYELQDTALTQIKTFY